MEWSRVSSRWVVETHRLLVPVMFKRVQAREGLVVCRVLTMVRGRASSSPVPESRASKSPEGCGGDPEEEEVEGFALVR